MSRAPPHVHQTKPELRRVVFSNNKKKIGGNNKSGNNVKRSSARRKNGGKSGGLLKVDLLDESKTKTKNNKDRGRRTTTTTTTLHFAPPSFSLTKSTRQLLEETVRGLNGFGVSSSTTSATTPSSSSFMAMANALPNVPPPPNLMMLAPPRPPPNTPILGKNPFARLSQDDDDDIRNDHGPVVVPPVPASFAFQPARFTVAADNAAAAPDVDPDF
jgi:hypothetical protein